MVGDVRTLAKSFERYLRATNRSPRRVETYLEAVDQFARFLDRQELPSVVTSLQQFFKYLLDEGELDASAWPTWRCPRSPSSRCPCWARTT